MKKYSTKKLIVSLAFIALCAVSFHALAYIYNPTGSGGGGGTIGGTIAANEVGFGSALNTLTSDANHTINSSTGYTNLQATVGSGETAQLNISNNIAGFGIKGVANLFESTLGGDSVISGLISGDLTAIGSEANQNLILTTNTTTNSSANITTIPDGSGNTNIGLSAQNTSGDGEDAGITLTNEIAGLNFEDAKLSSSAGVFADQSTGCTPSGTPGLGLKSANISWDWPCVDGTNGQVLMTDGFGNLSFGTVSVPSYTFTDSLVNTSGTVTLVNDNATPGDWYSYGTDGIGTLGYQIDPITISDVSSLVSTGIGTTFPSTVTNAIDFGVDAGTSATGTDQSIFIGNSAGSGATNSNLAVDIGYAAGYEATTAGDTVAIGNNAGIQASGSDNSVFIGQESGDGDTAAANSIFEGYQAGSGATAASNSEFLGEYAGDNAGAADNSNFFGESSGEGSTSAANSNFFGLGAGDDASLAHDSNFMGMNTGISGSSESFTNAFGKEAGGNATDAQFSNFIGQFAGQDATNANNAICIGAQACLSDTVDNLGSLNYAADSESGPFTPGEEISGSVSGATAFVKSDDHTSFLRIVDISGTFQPGTDIITGLESGNTISAANFLGIIPPGTSIAIGDNTGTGGFSNSIALGEGAINTAANQFLISPNIHLTTIPNAIATVPQYENQAAITTGTVTSNSSTQMVLDGTAATLSIVFPSSPVDGQQLFIACTGTITGITFAGGTVVGAPSTCAAGVNAGSHFVYSASSNSGSGEWVTY